MDSLLLGSQHLLMVGFPFSHGGMGPNGPENALSSCLLDDVSTTW
jgi:hypothetical protein